MPLGSDAHRNVTGAAVNSSPSPRSVRSNPATATSSPRTTPSTDRRHDGRESWTTASPKMITPSQNRTCPKVTDGLTRIPMIDENVPPTCMNRPGPAHSATVSAKAPPAISGAASTVDPERQPTVKPTVDQPMSRALAAVRGSRSDPLGEPGMPRPFIHASSAKPAMTRDASSQTFSAAQARRAEAPGPRPVDRGSCERAQRLPSQVANPAASGPRNTHEKVRRRIPRSHSSCQSPLRVTTWIVTTTAKTGAAHRPTEVRSQPKALTFVRLRR